METLKSFAAIMVFIAAAGFIYTFLLPSGKLSQTAKSVLSALVLLCSLSPLFSLAGQAPPSFSAAEYEYKEEYNGLWLQTVKETLAAEVRKTVSRYTDQPFELFIDANITETYIININSVRLVFRAAPAGIDELRSALCELLGTGAVLEVQEEE